MVTFIHLVELERPGYTLVFAMPVEHSCNRRNIASVIYELLKHYDRKHIANVAVEFVRAGRLKDDVVYTASCRPVIH